jgi:hypothetical protein
MSDFTRLNPPPKAAAKPDVRFALTVGEAYDNHLVFTLLSGLKSAV